MPYMERVTWGGIALHAGGLNQSATSTAVGEQAKAFDVENPKSKIG